MKVIVFFADGFEEVEALTVVDYLRRSDIDVDMVSIADKTIRGAHDIRVSGDKIISELSDLESYDGLVIPGGIPGATNLRDDKRVIEIIQDFNSREKLLAAICAGPIVLQRAEVIKGKNVTSYPGFEEELTGSLYKEDKVVRDGNIITARGPALAMDFAIEIVKYLKGEEKAGELKEGILYSQL